MLHTLALASLALVAQTRNAPIVINEFLYDNVGQDTIEFVELFNRSGELIDISLWVLAAADQDGPNASYVIPDGTLILPLQFYTIGAAGAPGRIDQVVGVTDLWEDDTESLTLRDPEGGIIDTVVYESVRGIWNPRLAEGPGIRPDFVSPVARPISLQRCPNGQDTGDNSADFHALPATPGAVFRPRAGIPFAGLFDRKSPGTVLEPWLGSNHDAVVIDPTVVGPANPNAIPPSRSGGNAMVAWNPAGGGNACYLDRCLPGATVVGCVYLESQLAPPGEGETWVLGFQGTVGSDAHHVDPTGQLGSLIPGNWQPANTGNAVVYQRTEAYAKLFVVDFGDGTAPITVDELDIEPGVNDGWRLLQISQSFGRLEVWIGERLTTFPTRIGGPVREASSGGVYIGYHESFGDDGLARPPTLDDTLISPILAEVEMLGDPVENHVATPLITFSGRPTLGSTQSVHSIGLLPGAPTFLSVGVARRQPIRLPRGLFPDGATVYLEIIHSVPYTPTETLMAVPWRIPNAPFVAGKQLAFQIFQFDFALPEPIPVTHTQAMVVTLGR